MDLKTVGSTFVGSHMTTQEMFLKKLKEESSGNIVSVIDMAINMIGFAKSHLTNRVEAITLEHIFMKVGKGLKPLPEYLPDPTPNMGVTDLIGLHAAFEEVLFCVTAKYSANTDISAFQAYQLAVRDVTRDVDVLEIHKKYAPFLVFGDDTTADFLEIYVKYVNFLKQI